jgi:hypothetical protein
MSSRRRLFVVSVTLTTGIVAWMAAAGAQSTTAKSDLETLSEFNEVFQRLERQDRQAIEDGILLDKSTNARRQDTKLSIGSVDDQSDLPYSLDPTQDPNPPPGFGLNLKMNF